jgi:hypothetical protein
MRKIRIDFCDFWDGFSKTDNWFVRLLRQRYEVEISDRPEFLFFAQPQLYQHRLHNCVKIYFGIESYEPDWRVCDYALTCNYLDDPRHLRLPLYVLYSRAADLVKPIPAPDPPPVPAGFCSFVVSNAGRARTQRRVDFFHRLSRYRRVDSGGRHLNNIGGPLPGGPRGKIEFLSRYKFHIAFENESRPGYTTEKLVEAMLAGTVPIYWGNPRIAEEFNPRSFVNAHDFPDDDALVQHIRMLDENPAAYDAVRREPFFSGNQPNAFYDENRVLEFFDRVVHRQITPVAQRRRWWQLGRWRLVKQNRPHGPLWK